tara:strand:+ start:202 stop:708 length:507 start_codon:yes stop_codon:yes gene_type:complete
MWIIAYGSLMNKQQFSGKSCKLVHVQGWKRIFNKVVSRDVWKRQSHGNYVGTLNVVEEENASFNAVAYEIDNAELSTLLQREEDYHTEEVVVKELKSGSPLENCLMFVSNETNEKGKPITRDDIFPIPAYLDVCRSGAYSWGEEFGEEFDRTTFLADRKITIETYLRT